MSSTTSVRYRTKKKLTGWSYEGAAMREALLGEPKLFCRKIFAEDFSGKIFGAFGG